MQQKELKVVKVGGRDLRCTMQPLMEVQLDIKVEELDNHERVSVKALLDRRAMEMFVDKKFVEKHGFKKEKTG